MLSPSSVAASLHTTRYRADIDGLRAVAVSSVVFFHAFPSLLPGGFVGVDVFFVISGYLISSILIGELETRNFSLLRFYDRRIRRIFPALIAVLLATSAAGWLVLFRPEFWSLGRHVVASTLFSENLLLLSEAGYFDVASETKPLLHLWSLAIEEQFYIFWPLLMWLAHRGHVRFTVVFVFLGLLSFGLDARDVVDDPTAAYYSPFGRFWELMVGAGFAQLQIHRPDLAARIPAAGSAVGALLLLAAFVLIGPTREFPGFWALLPTLGALLLIAAGPDAWINRRILSARPFVWCGLISYPLYLWHWPLLSGLHIVFGDAHPGLRVAAVVASVGLAAATFQWLERPFRRRGGGSARPLALAAAMVAVLVVGVGVLTDALPSRLWRIEVPTRDEWEFLRRHTTRFDANGNGVYEFHTERPRLAVFVGDSQLAQYAERIATVVDGDPTRPGAVLALGGGCIPIDGVDVPDPTRRQCPAVRDRGFELAAGDRVDTVLIGGSWYWYFLKLDYRLHDGGRELLLTSPEGRAAALARLEARIGTLTAAGKKVFLLIGNPMASGLSPASAKVRLTFATTLDADRMVAIDPQQLEVRRDLLALAERTGATVVDPYPILCAAGRCRATTADGRPIFKDASHFDPDWAAKEASFVDVATEPVPAR